MPKLIVMVHIGKKRLLSPEEVGAALAVPHGCHTGAVSVCAILKGRA